MHDVYGSTAAMHTTMRDTCMMPLGRKQRAAMHTNQHPSYEHEWDACMDDEWNV